MYSNYYREVKFNKLAEHWAFTPRDIPCFFRTLIVMASIEYGLLQVSYKKSYLSQRWRKHNKYTTQDLSYNMLVNMEMSFSSINYSECPMILSSGVETFQPRQWDTESGHEISTIATTHACPWLQLYTDKTSK